VSEAPAGRQVLAFFSVGKLAIAGVIWALAAWGAVALFGGAVSEPADSIDVQLGILSAFILLLCALYPAAILWQMLTRRGEAVWVEDGYLRWLPWGSAAVHDLVGVGLIRAAKGSRFGVTLEDGSQKPILVMFLSISSDQLQHAIEALKLGLAARDGGATAFN
jgi:hypothetical protein